MKFPPSNLPPTEKNSRRTCPDHSHLVYNHSPQTHQAAKNHNENHLHTALPARSGPSQEQQSNKQPNRPPNPPATSVEARSTLHFYIQSHIQDTKNIQQRYQNRSNPSSALQPVLRKHNQIHSNQILQASVTKSLSRYPSTNPVLKKIIHYLSLSKIYLLHHYPIMPTHYNNKNKASRAAAKLQSKTLTGKKPTRTKTTTGKLNRKKPPASSSSVENLFLEHAHRH